MSNYHNLDNEEVVFLYLSNKKFIDQYNTIFENGGIESVVDLSDSAYVVGFKQLSEQDLLNLMDDPHYKYCVNVNEKLEPIVELIRETLPKLYNMVEKSFSSTKHEI
jgi:hypothetical protein